MNIVDLVDTLATQKPVVHFPSEVALSVYSKRTRKIFPRENAHAGSVLNYLLRRIMFPREGTYTGGTGKGSNRFYQTLKLHVAYNLYQLSLPNAGSTAT